MNYAMVTLLFPLPEGTTKIPTEPFAGMPKSTRFASVVVDKDAPLPILCQSMGRVLQSDIEKSGWPE
jgi:hypothetical protein